MEAHLLLTQAIEAFNIGDKNRAKALLDELIIHEPANEEAWLLLAEVVEAPNEARDCLAQELKINPDNTQAREKMAARFGVTMAQTTSQANPPPLQEPEAVKTEPEIVSKKK